MKKKPCRIKGCTFFHQFVDPSEFIECTQKLQNVQIFDFQVRAAFEYALNEYDTYIKLVSNFCIQEDESNFGRVLPSIQSGINYLKIAKAKNIRVFFNSEPDLYDNAQSGDGKAKKLKFHDKLINPQNFQSSSATEDLSQRKGTESDEKSDENTKHRSQESEEKSGENSDEKSDEKSDENTKHRSQKTNECKTQNKKENQADKEIFDNSEIKGIRDSNTESVISKKCNTKIKNSCSNGGELGLMKFLGSFKSSENLENNTKVHNETKNPKEKQKAKNAIKTNDYLNNNKQNANKFCKDEQHFGTNKSNFTYDKATKNESNAKNMKYNYDQNQQNSSQNDHFDFKNYNAYDNSNGSKTTPTYFPNQKSQAKNNFNGYTQDSYSENTANFCYNGVNGQGYTNQQSYSNSQGTNQQNYSEQGTNQQSYSNKQGTNQQSYTEQGTNQQSYSNTQGTNQQTYSEQGTNQQSYSEQGTNQQSYSNTQGTNQQSYSNSQGFTNDTYYRDERQGYSNNEGDFYEQNIYQNDPYYSSNQFPKTETSNGMPYHGYYSPNNNYANQNTSGYENDFYGVKNNDYSAYEYNFKYESSNQGMDSGEYEANYKEFYPNSKKCEDNFQMYKNSDKQNHESYQINSIQPNGMEKNQERFMPDETNNYIGYNMPNYVYGEQKCEEIIDQNFSKRNN